MSIEPTYKLETPPVAAMTWEEYEPLVLSEWADLLESQSVPESAVQEFLERHPSMVPGAMGTIKSSGHYPYSCALFAKTVKDLPVAKARVRARQRMDPGNKLAVLGLA